MTTPFSTASAAAEDAAATPPPHPPGTTPVMAQFLDMKAAYPDCLLFFRMGDFYEMFFEDAGKAAEALGIALTKRGKSGGDDIPMCGVPYHHAERYLHDLISKGFRVAVAEQMEDPAEAKKRGSKAVVRRDVVRVVTPGTLTETELLDQGSHNYLAAFAARRDGGALAWADISTGDLRVTRCGADDLPAQLARLRPAELILRAPVDPDLAAMAEEIGATVSDLAASSFDPRRGDQRAAKPFGAATLDAFGGFEAPERSALGALVEYVELTQRGRLPVLKPPVQERFDGVMRIDAATRRNLELTVGPTGARDGSLLSVVDRTVTSGGARLLERRLASPLTEPDLIRARHEDVSFLLDESTTRSMLRHILRRTPDLDRSLGRLGLGRGGPRDLAGLRDGLIAARDVAAALANAPEPPPQLAACAVDLTGRDALIDTLVAGVAEDPPLRLSDGGAIAPGYDAELDEARALRDETRLVIADLQARLQDETQIAALKVKHNNVLGYFVETPATHANRMMGAPLNETFIHRQSTASAVRFTTVELSELESKIAQAADRATTLERTAFEALAAAVVASVTEIIATSEALAAIDVASSLAELAETERWVRPRVRADRAFRIVGGRHPVVEAALRQDMASGATGFVPNDCDLSADGSAAEPGLDADDPARPIWLLTGPNMAGKSTFLRQNALIAVLAQMGAFVPATEAEIGVVDQLFSRVGAADDLARGRSTFMVEMVETAAILNQAGPRALVILDEIGRGTATYDGLSIAWATLEHLDAVNKCRALFATHYHELTALASALPGLKNATMAVREWKGDVVFLRQVVAGAADRSYGVQVARLAGMPPAVVDRSKELLQLLETGSESAAMRAEKLVSDLPLFASAIEARPEPSASPILDRLRDLDPDTLTPRAALDALYELKALLDE